MTKSYLKCMGTQVSASLKPGIHNYSIAYFVCFDRLIRDIPDSKIIKCDKYMKFHRKSPTYYEDNSNFTYLWVWVLQYPASTVVKVKLVNKHDKTRWIIINVATQEQVCYAFSVLFEKNVSNHTWQRSL